MEERGSFNLSPSRRFVEMLTYEVVFLLSKKKIELRHFNKRKRICQKKFM